VRRLERDGLVAKARDADDERVVRVRLTDAGTALRAEIAPIHKKIAEIAGIGERQHRELISELREITARLHDA
jgi:DNA-binding MarR family transcriptional regulator